MRSLSLLVILGVTGLFGGVAMAAATPPTPAQDGGRWQLSLTTAADGSKVVMATLPANDKIPSGFDTVTPTLVLRYADGQTSAYVVFDTFLGTTDTLQATVTLGDASPEVQTWRLSHDGRAAFVPGDALAFVQRLKQADTYSVRVAPRKDRSLTAAFTPTGVDLVIKALLSAGVKYGGDGAR